MKSKTRAGPNRVGAFDSDEVKTKETQTCNEIAKVAIYLDLERKNHPIIRKKFAKELKGELSRKVSGIRSTF